MVSHLLRPIVFAFSQSSAAARNRIMFPVPAARPDGGFCGKWQGKFKIAVWWNLIFKPYVNFAKRGGKIISLFSQNTNAFYVFSPYIRVEDLMKTKDDFVSPLHDYVFSQVFGNKQNIGNTRAFLKTLLDIPGEDYGELTV